MAPTSPYIAIFYQIICRADLFSQTSYKESEFNQIQTVACLLA
jgi:hypothetical protein